MKKILITPRDIKLAVLTAVSYDDCLHILEQLLKGDFYMFRATLSTGERSKTNRLINDSDKLQTSLSLTPDNSLVLTICVSAKNLSITTSVKKSNYQFLFGPHARENELLKWWIEHLWEKIVLQPRPDVLLKLRQDMQLDKGTISSLVYMTEKEWIKLEAGEKFIPQSKWELLLHKIDRLNS